MYDTSCNLKVQLHRFASAKIHDFVELAGNLGAAHAHDGAVHVDVLAAGHLGVEPGAHFEEARDAAPCADGAGGGGGHAAQQLEERALACAVTPDDSHDVALFHLENPMSESRGQTCLAMAER